MLKTVLTRPWVCSRCLHQLRRAQKRPVRWQSSGPAAAAAEDTGRVPPVDHSSSGLQQDDAILRQIFDSPATWKAFPKSLRSAANVGLFRNAYLTRPTGFHAFARTSLEKAQKIVDKILTATSLQDYRVIVRDLDRLSDLLCRVIDLCDFVRATHPDYRTQEAASEAWSAVYQYMNQLNTTTGLNDQLNVAMANPDVFKLWSEEEKMVAEMLRLDFSKSAVSLPKEARHRFVELSQQVSEVGSSFVQEMAPDQHQVVFPSSKFLGMDPVEARKFTRRGTVSIPSLSGEAASALRNVYDEDTRKALYYAARTASARTVSRLETLMKLRSEIASLAGFESYGHMTLRDRMMAKSPESVRQFLLALWKHNAPTVREEMQDLLQEKRKLSNSPSVGLNAWDKAFYMQAIRGSMRSRVKQDDILSAYFSVGTVMQGISRLFNRLYGLRFIPRETLPGETWHHDVRRLDVVSDTDGHIAVLYCDLFYRNGKSPNPAHFTVRCSRDISDSEIEEAGRLMSESSDLPVFVSPEEAANDGMAMSNHDGVVKQLPTIALICDFQQSHANTPALLHFDQVETLFHEMGHAVHSVLARTSLQNVAGTRCATDLAELPSTLMEHFAADPSVLALFARHYETDAPLDHERVADRLRWMLRFEGAGDENQIILAMLDQEYHSKKALDLEFDSSQIYHDLQQTYSHGPVEPAGTRWQGFFGHLFGYGSTYYSYLFDRVLAERVWKEVFAGGRGGAAVSRENGEHLKESLLKWGGGREPWRCVADVLRDERIASGDDGAMALVGSWGTTNHPHAS